MMMSSAEVAPLSDNGRPADLGDGWALSNLAAGGFNADALTRALQAAATPQANLHGVVLERRGELVGEWYFTGPDKPLGKWFARKTRFGPEVPHDLRSVSKSIVGLLIGIAQAEGKIGSLATPVLEYFPRLEDADEPERRLITLDHMLTMTAGLEWDEAASYSSLRNSETRMNLSRDRVRHVMQQPVVAMPGSRFNYSGGTTAVLADILELTTGQPLETYARDRLFNPLDIDDFTWKKDSRGRAFASAGLRMRPRDLAKMGRMLLNGGRWQGRQVVPEEWVQTSMQPHVATGDGLQYGYQWWISATAGSSATPPWWGALGHGGQRLFMVPSLDLTVVLTAGRYKSTDRGSNELFRRIVGAALP